MNEQEHLNEIRQDNKKALPKFLLIMAASLVLGGVLGFFGGRLGDLGMKETLASAADWFSRYAAPWLLYACTLASVLGFLWTFLNPLLMLAVYSFVFPYIPVAQKYIGKNRLFLLWNCSMSPHREIDGIYFDRIDMCIYVSSLF